MGRRQVVAQAVIWHGNQQESFELVNAVAHNCSCEFGPANQRVSTCPPHAALAHDQRFLNGLLFARHFAQRWIQEELK
jgi:hypothetical protein